MQRERQIKRWLYHSPTQQQQQGNTPQSQLCFCFLQVSPDFQRLKAAHADCSVSEGAIDSCQVGRFAETVCQKSPSDNFRLFGVTSCRHVVLGELVVFWLLYCVAMQFDSLIDGPCRSWGQRVTRQVSSRGCDATRFGFPHTLWH